MDRRVYTYTCSQTVGQLLTATTGGETERWGDVKLLHMFRVVSMQTLVVRLYVCGPMYVGVFFCMCASIRAQDVQTLRPKF